MKTKKAVTKRMRLMGSGIIKTGQAGKRHCMRKRRAAMLRNSKGLTCITPCEIRRMAKGLGVGATRIKPKSNKKMLQDYLKNMSRGSIMGLIQNDEMSVQNTTSEVKNV